MNKKNILEIYSPFASVGRKVGFLQQKIVQYALRGLLIAFVITALIGIYKTLTRLESKYNKNQLLKTGG